MNSVEWEEARINGTVDHYFDRKCRAIQRSLQYNKDPNATVRHHLMNTPEQVAYNTTYYERWGFEINENGDEVFEYGKYIIFCTKEEHYNLWHDTHGDKNLRYGKEVSEETRDKISKASKKLWEDVDFKNRMSELHKLKWEKEGYRENFSIKMKEKYENEDYKNRHIEARLGEKNPRYGKVVSEETRNKISKANKGRIITEETRKHLRDAAKHKAPITKEARENLSKSVKETWKNAEERRKKFSERISGKNNPMASEETKQKVKVFFDNVSKIYKQYKSLGGTIPWSKFRSKDIFEKVSLAIKNGTIGSVL